MRTVLPAVQPVCCNCPAPHVHYRQIPNGEFRCTICDGFIGYCGENGCDMGWPHNCLSADTLRCFVRRDSSGCYVAECIDLDICAEAETVVAAISGLQDAMKGYLLVVLDNPATNQAVSVEAASLLRPSPLSHRIRYYFEYLKYRVAELIFRTHGRKAKRCNDVPPVPEEPKSKLGDLYILGEHRLLCGDSTKREDVERITFLLP